MYRRYKQEYSETNKTGYIKEVWTRNMEEENILVNNKRLEERNHIRYSDHKMPV